MSEEVKKLANQAIDLQSKIKSDTLKLQEIKKQLIELSKNRNNSYAINLPFGKIKIIKSKKLRTHLLDKKKFSDLDLQLKKKLVRNKVVKISYLINNVVYEKLLNEGLIDNEVKSLVTEKNRQPFYVYIYLNKKEVTEIKKEEEFQDIIEASEEGTEFDDEIEDILKDQELTQSIFSDDDPADMSDLEKQEKGFE
tara:strand:+ start:150 stop:734 length:585 start_codon:yes stop_codon:yes gene_type:complete